MHMETRLVHDALAADRDNERAAAERALNRGDTASFMEHAREYHRMSKIVGYPVDV